jgi:hypothetical protein
MITNQKQIKPKPISAIKSSSNIFNIKNKLNKTNTDKHIFWKRKIGTSKLNMYCNLGYKNSDTNCIEYPFDFHKKCKTEDVTFNWDRKLGTIMLSSFKRDKINICIKELKKITDSFCKIG